MIMLDMLSSQATLLFGPANMSIDFSQYIHSCSPPLFLLQNDKLKNTHGVMTSGFTNDLDLHCIANDYNDLLHPTLNHKTEVHASPLLSTIRKSHTLGNIPSTLKKCNSPLKVRKNVSFADDFGSQLTHIKFMYESSSTPPHISDDVIVKVTNSTHVNSDTPVLKLLFPHPVSDYQIFHKKINEEYVSLENVFLNEYSIHGMVKVRNIAFDKLVTVRYTTDGWKTNSDITAEHCSSGGRSDTFSFIINLPTNLSHKNTIQFCIRYQCQGQEYWDNNNRNNYSVGVELPEPESMSTLDKDYGGYSAWRQNEPDVPYW